MDGLIGKSAMSVIREWKERSSGGLVKIRELDSGLAVNYSSVLGARLPPPVLIEKLKSCGCLVIFPWQGAMRHTELVEFDSGFELAIVIGRAWASAMGLTPRLPRDE